MSDMWRRIGEKADTVLALTREMAAADAEARAMYYPEERAMDNNDVINTLKQAGFRVRLQHFRYYHLNKAGEITTKRHLLPTQAPRARVARALGLLEANGGATKCLVLMSTTAANTGHFAEGEARCADEAFNRSQGVRFALRDALLNLLSTLSADERQLMLINRSIEQLEQVENEYQEDVQLRAQAAFAREELNTATYGDIRAWSNRVRKLTPREERVKSLGAERERIEMRKTITAAPDAAETHAY